jgi:DNA-binding response OmpR family regulator
MAGKILIVEDDLQLADILANSLKQAGYEAAQAETSMQGISKALEERPDLILTDLHLPDMIAVDAIVALKSYPNTCDIPPSLSLRPRRPEMETQSTQSGSSGV